MKTTEWFNPKEIESEEEKKHKELVTSEMERFVEAFKNNFSEKDIENLTKHKQQG